VCVAKKEEGDVLKFLFSCLACNQIWLNLHVDHRHFGFITKLTPKKNTEIEIWVCPPVEWFSLFLRIVGFSFFISK
jgi:hypothetical protein